MRRAALDWKSPPDKSVVLRRLWVLPFLLALAGAVAADTTPEVFRWGVSGHPNVQEGYCQVPMATQINLVAQLGMGWYRCDWDQARLEHSRAVYDRLVGHALRKGIRILPIIFPSTSCRSEATPEEIRQASFEFARWLVGRYRGPITHWELDNELDLLAMVRKGERCRDGTVWQWGDPDGDRPEHYEEARYQKVRAELTGLYEGVKAADPEAMTIVNTGGWLHYGFIQRLVREDNVPFDILGWHWYSEMGDVTKVRGNFTLLEHLKGYSKPIWFTEVERRGGSQGGKEKQQAEYLTATARQLRAYPGVEAFFVYELLDEPYFGMDNAESYYGLVELVTGQTGRWTIGRRKEAFRALQRLMAPGVGLR
jgi:hypothetical protein